MNNILKINNSPKSISFNVKELSQNSIRASLDVFSIHRFGLTRFQKLTKSRPTKQMNSLFELAGKQTQTYPLMNRLNFHFTDDKQVRVISGISTVTNPKGGENPLKNFMYTLAAAESKEILPATTSSENELSNEEINALSREETLKLLESKNYYPNKISNAGESIIHLAVKKGDLLAVKLAIHYGLDPQMPNKAGNTPLHISAEKGDLEMTKFLIEKGVSLNWTNELNQTPYHKALKNKHAEILVLLKECGYQPNDGGTDYLIALGYNPTVVDNAGNTVIHKAAMANDIEVLKLLNAQGWPVDSVNKKDQTPLMLAVSKGNLEAANFLLEQQADINAKDIQGNTAVMIAVKQKQNFILNSLLENQKVQLNILNDKGIAALHYAVVKGDTYAVQALVKKGALINIKTSPPEWTDPRIWTRDDYDAWGEMGGAGPRGNLAPTATPLAIAERLHPGNTVMKEFLINKGATAYYVDEIDDEQSFSLEDYLKA